MSAFDELRRQLLDSVEQQAIGRRHSSALLRPRFSRLMRSRAGLLLIAIPLLFAAAAAARIAISSGESPANALLNRVLVAKGNATACRMTGPRKATLSSEAPDPRITAVLPELGSAQRPGPSAAVLEFAESHSGGTVLARTLHVVRVAGGFSLIVYVAHGQGPFTLVDPRRCLAARLATLARLRPNVHDRVRRAVAGMLRNAPEVNPGTQSLTLARREDRPGQPVAGGFDSFPLPPGRAPLPTGVLLSGSGCERSSLGRPLRCSPTFYAGIAKPDIAYLTVEPESGGAPARQRGSRRRIAVTQGLFAFTVPRGAGPQVVTQRTAGGRRLGVTFLGRSPTAGENGRNARQAAPEHRSAG